MPFVQLGMVTPTNLFVQEIARMHVCLLCGNYQVIKSRRVQSCDLQTNKRNTELCVGAVGFLVVPGDLSFARLSAADITCDKELIPRLNRQIYH